jgi:hypothetical protein
VASEVPLDAAEADATITIEIDAAITRPVVHRAPPDASEVIPVLGSARDADVNTTVPP